MNKTFLMAACVAAVFALDASAHESTKPLAGTLRISGNDQMAPLLARWEAGFRKLHPEVRFEHWLKGSGSGMYGLEMRTADIAVMGRPINPYERYGVYERAWVYPVEIQVATGSASEPHKSPAYAVFVNRANPLAHLTMQQLDGIFGAERSGGWNALTWDESVARGKDRNLRSWDQVGLQGAWTGQPIHVYGPPNLGTGSITAFQSMVMGGGEIFNEDLREYADRKQMLADLAKDPDGIAYGPLGDANPGVKAIALATSSGAPYVLPTRASVQDRSYPLARPVYMVYTIDNEKTEIASPRVQPLVREFLRFVLGSAGQRAVREQGTYLPLTPPVAGEQLRKMDFQGVPPERGLLKVED